MMEMKAIFQLFDPEGTDEISIQHVNNLIRELETLKSETDSLAVPSQPGRKYVRKGNPTENFEDRDASPKSPTYVSVTELKYPSTYLGAFPTGRPPCASTISRSSSTSAWATRSSTTSSCRTHSPCSTSTRAAASIRRKSKKYSKSFRTTPPKKKSRVSLPPTPLDVLKFCGVQND